MLDKKYRESDRKHLMIDIESMLPEKIRKNLPRFVINWLRRVVHENDVNEGIYLAKDGEEQGVKFFGHALRYVGMTYEVRGVENLPKEGERCVFASNHPLGGPEALIMGDVMHSYFGNAFKVPVNSILASLKPLTEFFVPVNALGGRQSRDLSKRIGDMFTSDEQVLVYPAGKCSRWRKGVVTEMPWKKMFVSQSKKYERDIIPIHCSGFNSKKFYRLTWLSEKLGLKVSIGMLYLVDELFKQKGNHFVITFGERISYSSFDKSKTDQQWADDVLETVKQLEKGNNQKPNMGVN